VRTYGPGGFGLIPDPPGLVTKSAAPFLALVGAGVTPSSASIPHAPIKDQYPVSACVGFAAAGALETAFAAHGQPVTPRSGQGIYTLARCAGRETGTSLDDRGSVPWVAMQALTDWGAPSEAAWVFDPSKVNEEPRLGELEAADMFKLRGFYRIDSFGAERLDAIKTAIAAGHPCFFATSVDAAFEQWNGQGVISSETGPSLGGHAMYMTAFSETASGLVVEITNSWGLSWGRSGTGLVDEQFIAGCSSLYVIDPAVVS